MDVVLFVFYSVGGYDFDWGYKWSVFEWFGMVYGIFVDIVKKWVSIVFLGVNVIDEWIVGECRVVRVLDGLFF